jgi:hypothetical protein
MILKNDSPLLQHLGKAKGEHARQKASARENSGALLFAGVAAK